MPHHVKISKSGPAQLSISWETKGSEFPLIAHRSKPEYHIVLHAESCNAIESPLFHGRSGMYQETNSYIRTLIKRIADHSVLSLLS